MIYVASSWRNHFQPAVVAALRSAHRQQPEGGFEPYDFKNPRPGDTGFQWTAVGMPSYDLNQNYSPPLVTFEDYKAGISHPIAEEGFRSDMDAMEASHTCVLVLPCGRSAHLEAGWFAGQPERKLFILMADERSGGAPEYDDYSVMVLPELMYKMADGISDNLFELLGLLGVED